MSVVRYYTKHGPRYVVIDKKKPVKDIFGTLNYSNEKNTYVLGPPENHNHYPTKRPDWNISPKVENTYRTYDPTWRGKYDDTINEFVNPRGQKLKKYRRKGVHLIDNDFYRSDLNENFENSNHYVEKSWNARVEDHVLRQRKGDNTYLNDKGFISYDGKTWFDPKKNGNVSYLPPLERNKRHAFVDSKVKSSKSEGHTPDSGSRHYPTFDLHWRSKAKVDSHWNSNGRNSQSVSLNSDLKPDVPLQSGSNRTADDHYILADDIIKRTSTEKFTGANYNRGKPYSSIKTNNDSKIKSIRAWNSSKFAPPPPVKKAKPSGTKPIKNFNESEQMFRFWESRLHSSATPPDFSDLTKSKDSGNEPDNAESFSMKTQTLREDYTEAGGYSTVSENTSKTADVPASTVTSRRSKNHAGSNVIKPNSKISKHSRLSGSTHGTGDTDITSVHMVIGKQTQNSIYATGPRLRQSKKEK